ncbi:MAG: insulinase family protein [Candidatus Zixiibacteriota bacterium]|nr:MAG: insulinase family protein [candidate division Zixibacteria bacterium]
MKKKIINIFIVTACFAILSRIAWADKEQPFPVNEIKLDNGLTVLVVERPGAPVFTGYICAGAGSAYEKIGNIGTAHLLEHMMFKGSESVGTSNIDAEKELWIKEDSVWARIDAANRKMRYIELNQPDKLKEHLKYIEDLNSILDSLVKASSQYTIPNEFDRIYTRHGAAQFNAWTGYDITSYHVSLPSNRLGLWFKMESDRLKKPAFREFFTERDVVSEERRQSVENNSESKLFEQLIATAFLAHPYQIYWEWQSEVNNLTRKDLEEYFSTYYTPSNLTIAVVGDIKTDDIKKLAEKYFGDMPYQDNFEPIYTVEPEQLGERRINVSFDASPAVYIAYHKTPFDTPDEPVFKIIGRLIGDGRTSRLYKSLVLDKQVCLKVEVDFFPGGVMGDRHPGVMNIYAEPKEGVSTAEVETAIYEELEKLATELVDDTELTKIKNNIDADYIWASYTNFGLAYRLAITQNMTHDWRNLFKLREKLLAVKPEDIKRVAAQYLTEHNRTVATLIPVKKGGNR